MKVEITGSSIANFVVTVEDGSASAQYVIQTELTIDEAHLEQSVATSAANEHFWHQLAVDAEHERKLFEEIDYAQYAAHMDRFARYYLRGIGDKNPTLTDKKSAAVMLFSSVSRAEPIAMQACYNGYAAEAKSVGIAPAGMPAFVNDMVYLYEHHFEEAKARMLGLEYQAEQLKAIASAFNSRSWAIKTMAADRRALIGSGVGT